MRLFTLPRIRGHAVVSRWHHTGPWQLLVPEKKSYRSRIAINIARSLSSSIWVVGRKETIYDPHLPKGEVTFFSVERGSDFFSLSKKGALAFFIEKKGAATFFHRKKRGGDFLSSKKRGRRLFIEKRGHGGLFIEMHAHPYLFRLISCLVSSWVPCAKKHAGCHAFLSTVVSSCEPCAKSMRCITSSICPLWR